VRHGLKEGNDAAIPGTFGIFSRNGMFHIYSANLIPNEDAGKIEAKLNHVNKLGPEELKAYYKEVLSLGAVSSKGGAGLGLIEMARKSGKPLQYHFTPKGNLTEFALQIDYNLAKDGSEVAETPILQSLAFSEKLSSLGVLMFFKGDFKTEAANSMLHMLAENTATMDDLDGMDKKIYHAGVELLQNLCRHGDIGDGKAMGIFMLASDGGNVSIITQNFTTEAGRKKLETHIGEINSKSPDELNKWYREKLKSSALEDTNSAGVGLIDIGRLSGNPIVYSTETVSNKCLFTIHVNITHK
jgi:hypothetical protein